MSFLTAGISVLKETGLEMTAAEIAGMALERGLIKSKGKTPGATLAAQLYIYVRDHPQGPVRKIAEHGETRARRDSVRWAWRD
ncbi:MAG TPA: winged helix-turn-helix domain-containing protein [Patescibacteria group bacterium]|nr:winged helix-turn-helix domain-containing protein [Patescibacteria group bacterium]